MSADTILKSGIIAVVIAVTTAMMWSLGLAFPPEDLCNPLSITLALGIGIWFYRRKQEREFVLTLSALLHLTLYTACYSVLMYSLGAIGRPYVDDSLVAIDRTIGLHIPTIAHWASTHPQIESLLQIAYNSLLWQTPLVIIILGFQGDRLRLEGFVRQFMFGTLCCAFVFAFWPAEGPFVAYGYRPSASQGRYLEHLHQLREGTRTLITWRGAEGLITVPSFHTIWGLLLVWAMRGHRGWMSLFAVVNGAVVLATMTTGWHYATDVCTGLAVTGGVVTLSALWDRRFAPVEPHLDELPVTVTPVSVDPAYQPAV